MANTSKDLLHLEHWNSSSSSLESTLRVCENASSTRNKMPIHSDKKPRIASVPTSQVLGKVKDFLGVMSEANKRLQHDAMEQAPGDYNIEVLTGNESEYIEMDLMLGLADLHTPEAVAAAESAVAGLQSVRSQSASNSETESDDTVISSDDDDNGEDSVKHREMPSLTVATSESLKDPPEGMRQSRKRPLIIELGS